MLWLEIPAYAGSTSPAPAGQGPAPDHPRIRGEHRSTAGTTASRRGSSPHTRGALGILLAIFIQLGIIPAYAGSTTRWSSPSWSPWDHPRIRGEHVSDEVGQVGEGGSSPHTRGAPRDVPPENIDIGIIPAYAGSTLHRRRPHPGGSDHPRIRGEHSMRHLRYGVVWGSSPHTRGAPVRVDGADHVGRIIPAYAGSTRRRPDRTSWIQDHPRIRGEHPAEHPLAAYASGSSPHTRGARADQAGRPLARRIIPAYAGSTVRHVVHVGPPPDHPRIRGEHGVLRGGPAVGEGSSPHTRGAPQARLRRRLRERIIPAYAGSTPTCPRQASPSPDHPRIRGEHVRETAPANGTIGSSPHTRGARAYKRRARQKSRIIPAYAGSTSVFI